MTGSEPTLNLVPDTQEPAPKSCWDTPLHSPPHPYPGCGQDPQGEETGSKQIPESMPVKLQSHGQEHSPQQIQHLEKEDSGTGPGWTEAPGNAPGEAGSGLQVDFSYCCPPGPTLD